MIHTSRRTFMSSTAAASALSAFPFIRSAQGASSNEKVNLACIGIGCRGEQVIEELTKTGLCNVVALCDTDMGAKHTQKIMKKFPDAPRFQDFRKMFDKMSNQIDAVSICTPDHSHFVIAMHAMTLGKHVYVEKPLAHTFQQVDLLMAAEKKYKVVTQMGNQGHSDANYFQFKAWTDAGIIKNVRKIVGHMNGVRRWHKWNGNVPGFRAAEKMPETLDWDIWLAQVQHHEYNTDYMIGEWRSWFEFGNGALGDWGAHILDTAHEFLKLGMPTEVLPVKMTGWNKFVFPMETTLQFKFADRGPNLPACDLFWYDGTKNFPDLPEGYGKAVDSNAPSSGGGTGAGKALPPGKEIYSDDLVFKGGSHGSTLSIIPGEKAKALAGKLPEYPKNNSNHFENFFKACKGQEVARSRFEISGPLCQMMGLGILVQRLNAKLEFDSVTRKITNHEVANALLSGPAPRQGWEQYFKV
jgi:predicted dehydrogenase